MLLQILLAILAVGLPCIAAISIVFGVRGNSVEVVVVEAVVLLVAIVPIANQVVCTSTLALGGRTLAEHKAIVTRLSSIEQLAGMAVLCSDKTGTLTLNKMVMQHVVTADGVAHHWPDEMEASAAATEVLQCAALATKWKESPKDALDTLVLGAAQRSGWLAQLDTYTQVHTYTYKYKYKYTHTHMHTHLHLHLHLHAARLLALRPVDQADHGHASGRPGQGVRGEQGRATRGAAYGA